MYNVVRRITAKARSLYTAPTTMSAAAAARRHPSATVSHVKAARKKRAIVIVTVGVAVAALITAKARSLTAVFEPLATARAHKRRRFHVRPGDSRVCAGPWASMSAAAAARKHPICGATVSHAKVHKTIAMVMAARVGVAVTAFCIF